VDPATVSFWISIYSASLATVLGSFAVLSFFQDRRLKLEIRLYRTIFPQMTNWLPDEEAAQLRFEFETELARLGV
jgi:hypothetical protein